MATFAKSEGFSEGCPWSTAYDAGPCLFVYRDRLDKSSVITSPPFFDYLRKALVLPTLLLKEDNS